MSADLFATARPHSAQAHPALLHPALSSATAAGADFAAAPAERVRRRRSVTRPITGQAHPAAPVSIPRTELTARLPGLDDEVAFAIGWDHAHHGLPLPALADVRDGALHNGWRAGVATFGDRPLPSTAAAQQWLKLRLQAWRQGLSVELMQVTPGLVQRLALSHCPITREPLQGACAVAGGIDRVRHDAGVAAGNLAALSDRAIAARRNLDAQACIAIARQMESRRDRGAAGLARGISVPPAPDDCTALSATGHHDCTALSAAGHHDCTALSAAGHHDCTALSAAQWGRAAVLASFVEPMAHERACELPLLVLPPNRLRLFNPAQALQALVSQQLVAPGWSRRINALELLMPTPAARRAFRSFFQALLPRVLEAGVRDDGSRLRWAIEDAWRDASVMRRWVRFALLIGADACERVVTSAARAGIAPDGVRFEALPDARATEGWCLDSGGLVRGSAS